MLLHASEKFELDILKLLHSTGYIAGGQALTPE